MDGWMDGWMDGITVQEAAIQNNIMQISMAHRICVINRGNALSSWHLHVEVQTDIWTVLCTSGPTLKFIILQKTVFLSLHKWTKPRWLGPVVQRRVVGWSIGFNHLLSILMG